MLKFISYAWRLKSNSWFNCVCLPFIQLKRWCSLQGSFVEKMLSWLFMRPLLWITQQILMNTIFGMWRNVFGKFIAFDKTLLPYLQAITILNLITYLLAQSSRKWSPLQKRKRNKIFFSSPEIFRGSLVWRSLRPCSHYAGVIWKRSLVSTVKPTVHTNPSRKRRFSKTLFKPEEFENAGPALRFSELWKHFGNRAMIM